MDKAERLAVIRTLYLAKAGGMAFRSTKPLRQPVPVPQKVTKLVIGWPQIIPGTKRAPSWFKAPSVALEAPLGERRVKTVSALTRIAEKWPHAPKLAAPQKP